MEHANRTRLSRRTFLSIAAATSGGVFGSINAADSDPALDNQNQMEIEILFDGKRAQEWNTERGASRLKREFSLSAVTETSDRNALNWRFIPRAGTSFNDLWLNKPISSPFHSISMLIRNNGASFTLAAKVSDADGSEWTAEKVTLPSAAGWRWITFPYSKWKVASWSIDADGNLDFPLSTFVIIAYDLQAGSEYNLNVARVEIIRPIPPDAVIHHFDIPTKLIHGRTYHASITFELSKRCQWGSSSLLFTRNGKPMFRSPIPLTEPVTQIPAGKAYSISHFLVDIPEYAFGGHYQVGVELGEAAVDWSLFQTGEPSVLIAPRTPKETIVQRKQWNGTPTLFIDDQPVNGIAYTAYQPSVQVFRQFTRAGVNIFSFEATPTASNYGLAQTAWLEPGKYDFSQLDERATMVLQANPNAYFFLRLYLDAPDWWLKQHPDDLVLMDSGNGKYTPFISPGNNLPAPSWASEAWRDATIEGLGQLIAHVEKSPYSDRCIGYHLASGTTEEWMMWGANEEEWVDYSPVNIARFRQWLKRLYRTVTELRSSWHNEDVTFSTAQIPSKAKRRQNDFGSLRDPSKEQSVIDFYLYNSDLVVDTIQTLAKAVKNLTKRIKIVGVFYGYLLQLCGEQRQQNAGHLALEKVVSSPDVDFLCSPTSYAFRELGGAGTSHFMSLLGSVHLHGKLWFDENDIRTSLSGGQVGVWGRPKDVAGDILQQTKELANVIVNGAGQWWFDVGGNRYDNPLLMKELEALTLISKDALKLNRSPVDEVAMIVDERSLSYLRVGDPLGTWLLLSQLPALLRIGAPVAEYLSSDIPLIRNRKMFLFMTSFAPDPDNLYAIESLKSGKRTLVFFYAPGLIHNNQITPSAMSDLTGIRLQMSVNPSMLQAVLDGAHPLTHGMDGLKVGVESSTFPICYCDDPKVETLAFFSDGKPAIVKKEFPDWTSIFSSVPMLPAELLRRFASAASVHAYIQTEDVVWASRNMLAVCVDAPGNRRISLPRRARVRDIFRKQIIGAGIDAFDADFKPLETRLFALETYQC